MTIFVALVLTAATFAFVTYPLLKRKPALSGSFEDEELGELSSRRNTTYSMLKELEFDFQSGVLTEEDYHDLEERYKKKAISILKGIDNLDKSPEADDEIEKQVLNLRRGKARPRRQISTKSKRGETGDEIEKQVLALRRSRTHRPQTAARAKKETDIKQKAEKEVQQMPREERNFCSQCGSRVEESDFFCSNCGANLKKEPQID
ncbi:MAG: hypothetical protein Q8O55_03120 [Dehalococcoidales bacterium]|nr:hypothetical protein [Dehalococcoidales bacterium]MDZ4230657.1 hypothetical protein [Dehalococcoidales bacterium]